jgi:hypothetical protein
LAIPTKLEAGKLLPHLVVALQFVDGARKSHLSRFEDKGPVFMVAKNP